MADFNVLEPLANEPPCGPDLEAQEDDAFLDYYYEAESRLPERYFIPGNPGDRREDRLFDPRSVDLGAEAAAIRALLARSRDLRLLSLLARFQILAGRLEDFTATVEDMAAALAQWPHDLHPQGSARRAAIEALNAQATAVMPLMHLSVVPNGEVTLRRYMVVTGKASPRESEQDLAGSDFLGALRSDANLRAVTQVHERLSRLLDALHRIAALAAGQGFRPDLAALRDAAAEMQGMIAAARPELPPWQAAAEAEAPVPAADPTVADAPAPLPAPPASERPVPDRAAAEAALDAARAWLAVQEPSSPALMLVAQARALIGRPLVEALEMLMPQQAGAAVLRIGQGTPFALPMERLKALTQAGLEGRPAVTPTPAAPPPIARRADLVATLQGVEGYFAAHEPASPVPLLLAKARDMLHKRFDAIVAELLAQAGSGGET
ncbi:type VI secretion system ImpA family N-terminal domain-containing protein [Paracoccus sp. N5]|uniref:type VI secretion system ImpA family N-terminal domain-containing protein n=1 Tax=Paracoccus sp. N5 TaxID=1101189 RepID=UPI00037A6BD1|nr:type VI secretion system ImpA family N-terminal domain-containing protein [Paracoccus sp. N5]